MSFAVRIVLIGATNIGKHSLITRKVNNSFSLEYTPGRQDSYTITMQACERSWEVDLMHAADGDFAAMMQQAIRMGEAFVICFCLAGGPSFERVRSIYQTITEVKGKKWPAVAVCGCQKDRVDERTVTVEQGVQLSKSLDHAVPYFETSAVTGE
eukprot:TRINITY_DN8670_c0_g1_i1.p1 TRINITY_DN8670_c0_g1~~TRINITY_DN8670_c0_g1_i1.p1  ORF type:complete len:154 (-),score=8.19 TRINITY_DN8670_c0_g1_i1:160-621(-)